MHFVQGALSFETVREKHNRVLLATRILLFLFCTERGRAFFSRSYTEPCEKIVKLMQLQLQGKTQHAQIYLAENFCKKSYVIWTNPELPLRDAKPLMKVQ